MSWFRSRLLALTAATLFVTAIVPLVILSIVGIRGYQSRGQADIDMASTLLNERSLDLLASRAADTATRATPSGVSVIFSSFCLNWSARSPCRRASRA